MREAILSLADNRKVEIALFEPRYPIGTVQILHGMAEHMARYYKIGEYFEAMGYKVIIHNHQGHGIHIADEDRGHFDSMNQLVEDANEILETFVLPNQPVVLMGHSMGSIVARLYTIKYPQLFDALILSGTSYYDKEHKSARIALNAMQKVIVPSTRLARVNAMTLKRFNKKIKPLKTESDWLSWNETNVQSFIDDPYTGFHMSIRALEQILTTMKETQDKKGLKKMNPHMPVLLIAGEDDAFSNYGKGINKLGYLYKEAGLNHVMVQLYPHARHEILFENNQDEVLDRLTLWLKGHLDESR